MAKTKLVSTGELAPLLGVSSRTIARYAKEGKLQPAIKSLGGQYRWDVEDVLKQWDEFHKRQE